MKASEGYIKFFCQWKNNDFPISENEFIAINGWRNRLYNLKLIGEYTNGIGYGNVSIRFNQTNNFIITGSSTGHLPVLSKQHYSLVTGYDFIKNMVSCTGRARASSESLSHAAVYESNPEINAVIHVHNLEIYKKLKGKIATTNSKAEYGTPEMAEEIKRIIKQADYTNQGLIIMGGHDEGLISFGDDLEIAGNLILEKFNA